MKSRSKSRDLLALIVVLCATAVLTRAFFLNSAISAQQSLWQSDLQMALERFYGGPAEVRPDFAQHLCRLSVTIPHDLKQRHPDWVYRIASFVTQRHPAIAVQRWEAMDRAQGGILPENAAPSRDGSPAAIVSNYELAHAEMLARKTQSMLDAATGKGRFLILVHVDAEMTAYASRGPLSSRRRSASERKINVAGARRPPHDHVSERMAPDDGAYVSESPRPPRNRLQNRRIQAYLLLAKDDLDQHREKIVAMCNSALGLQETRGDRLEALEFSLPPVPATATPTSH